MLYHYPLDTLTYLEDTGHIPLVWYLCDHAYKCRGAGYFCACVSLLTPYNSSFDIPGGHFLRMTNCRSGKTPLVEPLVFYHFTFSINCVHRLLWLESILWTDTLSDLISGITFGFPSDVLRPNLPLHRIVYNTDISRVEFIIICITNALILSLL